MCIIPSFLHPSKLHLNVTMRNLFYFIIFNTVFTLAMITTTVWADGTPRTIDYRIQHPRIPHYNGNMPGAWPASTMLEKSYQGVVKVQEA